jgi:hypothetical protein
MLIQRRNGALRLIRQHDHALLAGTLAFAWRTATGEGPTWETALATALHDVVWREEDRRPRFDPEAGIAYDFTTVPPDHKRDFVEAGIGRLEQVDPALAALVRAHHRSLAKGSRVDPGSQLAWLRFFDNFSLLACLTPPGSLPEAHPPWLATSAVHPPDGSQAVTWRSEDELSLSPFPFGSTPLVVEIPYRDLPERRYESEVELRDAWERASKARWRLALTDGDRPG